MNLELEIKNSHLKILGPVFLLCTLFLAGKTPFMGGYDLAFVAAFGLYLSAKWHVRGCVYALILLLATAVAKHLFLDGQHLWYAAFEGSIALALLITALVSEQSATHLDSLTQQNSASAQTIQNLEEDLKQQREFAAQESTASAEKLAELRLQLEEAHTELSSYLVLNEVLRKSTAKSLEEKELMALQILQSDTKVARLVREIGSLEQRLNTDLHAQNTALREEINDLNVERMQYHLKQEQFDVERVENEQLFVRIRELELAAKTEGDQLQARIGELESAAKAESDRLAFHIRDLELAAKAESDQLQARIKELEAAAKNESNQLQARIVELESTANQCPQLLARINELEQRVEPEKKDNSELELLYRQLKVNYETRNEVLHETRAQLFHSDTALQTLKAEMAQKELEFDPMPPELTREMEAVVAENNDLQRENELLQELVTQLMESTQSVKKKVKRGPPLQATQCDLFA